MPEGEAGRVSVVTVSYWSAGVVGGFLASLPRAIVSEVVVVDNTHGADEALTAVVARYQGVRILRLPNPGYGAAMNAGVASLERRPEWLLLSNPDIELGTGSLQALIAAGDRHPDAAALGPRIRDADGDVYPSARRLPSLRTGIGHALFSRVWASNPWSAQYREQGPGTYAVERRAGWLSGSVLLVRTTAFERLRGFDESYFMYFEDVDLGDRIAREGFTNWLVPDAEARHAGAHSTSRHAGPMLVEHHRSAYRYLARKYSGPMLFPVRVVLKVGLVVRRRVVRSKP